MKTEKEWLDIYHNFWKLFGNNNVRLTLGQFDDKNRWGKVSIVGSFCWEAKYSMNKIKELITLAEKYNLRIDMGSIHNDEIDFWEEYEEDASSTESVKEKDGN